MPGEGGMLLFGSRPETAARQVLNNDMVRQRSFSGLEEGGGDPDHVFCKACGEVTKLCICRNKA